MGSYQEPFILNDSGSEEIDTTVGLEKLFFCIFNANSIPSIKVRNIVKRKYSPSPFGSLVKALACALKGPRFDSGKDTYLGFRFNPQSGRVQTIDVSLSH